MKLRTLLGGLVLICMGLSPVMAQKAKKMPKAKQAIVASVDKHQAELTELSDKIWAFAETALEETNSSKALADYAEKQGFKVERGVANMPTAFMASYGSGSPIIGIMGEFDALPGISQKAQPTKAPYKAGAPGHGCGHNLFGAGSLGAAVAVKEWMEANNIAGTLRFYGTPAEETIGGKLYMVREGLFDDLDVCLDWHPGANTEANTQSSKALIDFYVEFEGKAAHASADPWNGKSSVDALELYTTGLNYYREHIRPSARIHYLIEHAGDVVNVVPEHAKIWTRLRESKVEQVYAMYERAKKMAEGAAMMADVEYKITLISGMHNILVNRTGAAALQANLELLGPIQYTEEELAFAKTIQRETGKKELGLNSEIKPLLPTAPDPGGGSTDVGDVSWVVPEISLSATTAPDKTPWHSWAVVACGGMSIGHKGLLLASKSLGMTMVDLFTDADLRQNMRKEFKERKGDYKYKPIIPDGPPPVPETATGRN